MQPSGAGASVEACAGGGGGGGGRATSSRDVDRYEWRKPRPTLLRLLRLAKDQVRCCGASMFPLEPARLAPSSSVVEVANMPLGSSESAPMSGF